MVATPPPDAALIRRPVPAFAMPFVSRLRRHIRTLSLLVVLGAAGYVAASAYYRLPAWNAPVIVARIVAAPLLGFVRHGDTAAADVQRDRYWVGESDLRHRDGVSSWHRAVRQVPGLRLLDADGARALPSGIPFVYERFDAPYLRELVDTHDLAGVVAGAADEYEAMLRLGAWLGGRFDHGADAFGRRQDKTSPVEVIRLGEAGKRFWCEVAARLTVHAATALGWQARLVTASVSGYTWDHAVAEIWSNQFRKWFVIDTDFNVVYEADGVPLSAFELCHRGLALQQAHRLVVRAIAPPKPSLPTIDLLPFYAYVHVDLRNDWNSRFLGIGSPEGGDRATWWSARPSLGPVLTAKAREERPERFDWPVNMVSVHATDAARLDADHIQVRLALVAYSPSFVAFETSVDGGPWVRHAGADVAVSMGTGPHAIRARIVGQRNVTGPPSEVRLEFQPQAAAIHR